MSNLDGPSANEGRDLQEKSGGTNHAGRGLPLYPNLEFPPDPILTAAGWQRRFTTDRLRLAEHIQLYEQSGYEVQSMPLKRTDLHDDCEGCRLVTDFFVTIYTRKKGQGK